MAMTGSLYSVWAWLRVSGFTVKDVHRTHSYDFEVEKDAVKAIVEVKGTTSLGGSIFLTENEVQAHRGTHPHNILILIHSINLSQDRKAATGGTMVVHDPWKIEDLSLAPIAYQYRF